MRHRRPADTREFRGMHCGYLRFGPHSRPERTGQRADYPWGQRCLWRENGLHTALREGVLSPWNKDEETNLTVFDNTNCIGCHSCAMACPCGWWTWMQGTKRMKKRPCRSWERKFWNFRCEKKWHGRNAAVPFFNCFLTFRPNLTTLNEESIGMGNLSMEMVR